MENKKSKHVDLKKKTGQHFLMGLSIALSLSLVAFEWRTPENQKISEDLGTEIQVEDDELPPITVRKIPKPTPPVPKFKPQPPQPVVDPVVVTVTQDPVVEPVDLPTSEPAGDVNPDAFFVEEVEDNEIHPYVELMPEYVGGERELFKYLGANIKYPRIAKDSRIQGTVFVEFIVNKDGSISDTKVLRGIGGGCDEEAIRVVEKMKNWKPGMQGGRNVRVLFRLPIKFILKN